MSGNRTFDYSFFYKRRQDLVNSRNQYLNNVNGQRIIYNTQLSDWNASRQATFAEGATTMVFRGTYGNGENVSVGGIVNIPPYPPEVVITATTDPIPTDPDPTDPVPTVPVQSEPAPSEPAPSEPEPAYTPDTQLLLNSEFTNITNSAADNWHSTQGWQSWNLTSGSRPTAVMDMPTRDVYPTSTSTGFVIFSYTTVTISQTVAIDNLVGINTITGVLNIANVSNGGVDTFTFLIEYKSSTGSILYTTTTNSTNAPASWTDYTLTLTRDTSPKFDLIKSIKVSIVGKDTGFWAGQYGPAMDYCRLTVS
jgi:hypothetical protein